MLTVRGERAKVQNEIVDGKHDATALNAIEARNSTGRSRGNAVAAVEGIGQVRSGAPGRPLALPSLPLICELRVDLIVPTPTWSLIHGCMRSRDRLRRVKFKLMERPLFRSVQTLENAPGVQEYCKKTGRSNRV